MKINVYTKVCAKIFIVVLFIKLTTGNLRTTQKHINSRLYKQIVMHLNNGMVLSNKKMYITVIHNNMINLIALY